jgi:hypothetical protein
MAGNQQPRVEATPPGPWEASVREVLLDRLYGDTRGELIDVWQVLDGEFWRATTSSRGNVLLRRRYDQH